MNILWHSNSALVPSGYGIPTRLFTGQLKQAGHQVTISAYRGHEGSALHNEQGILELPRGGDPYGNDIIAAHAQYAQAEVVISMMDPFVLRPDVWKHLPWVAWVPVDSAPMRPDNLAPLQAARWILAMSHFGEQQLKAAGFSPLYVPLGVDTTVYKPQDRTLARQAFGQKIGQDLTGKFLVVSVAANQGIPSRKNFSGMFQAFALFAKEHPEALLYVHTEPAGLFQGEPLFQLTQFYGIADKVIFPAQYMTICGLTSAEDMNVFYNAADVFLLLSRGEGFGIPIVEAQSAGCPVIVTDFSASAELCLTGWRVPGQPYMFTPGAIQKLAIPERAAEALSAMFELSSEGTAERVRQTAHERALEYDVKTVTERYLLPALTKIAQDLEEARHVA